MSLPEGRFGLAITGHRHTGSGFSETFDPACIAVPKRTNSIADEADILAINTVPARHPPFDRTLLTYIRPDRPSPRLDAGFSSVKLTDDLPGAIG